MGYTHYFTHTEVTQEVWDTIVKDCRKLKKKMPGKSLSAGGHYKSDDLVLGKWDGETKLRVMGSKKRLQFNGFPADLAHETFSLYRTGSDGFEFCKTRRKPYDLMVCACLIVYTHHSQETIELRSDGDREDWEPAINFVGQVLGAEYEIKFRMEYWL